MRPATQSNKNPLRGLLISQFFGAFNDNAWKIIVVELAVAAVLASPVADAADLEAATLNQTTLAFLVLVIPLAVFSLPAGLLCDRVSKRTVIIWMKVLELMMMTAATVSLMVAPHNLFLPLAVLGFMGLQSSFFGPAKYGILPEILPHERLSAGNGLLESWTFLAIIGGTALGGFLLDWAEDFGGGNYLWFAPLTLALLSVIGLVAARGVPHVPVARAEGGLARTVSTAWQAMRVDRVLRLTVYGSCFYWSVASLVGTIILVYGRLELGLEHPGILLALFGLGVGAGSLLAGKLSANKVEYGLIPLGAIGLALFMLVLGMLPPTLIATLPLLVLLGVSSGFIVVPLNALLQWRSPPDRRGAVIALSRVLVFSGMAAGTLAGPAMATALDLPTRGTLLGCALITAGGTIWALKILPDAFLRLVLVFVTNTFYRLRVTGTHHLPSEGGALLVPNHVSFVDGLFLFASVDRPIRFIVDSAYLRHPVYGPFLRSLKAIEISSSGGPRIILRAMREAGKLLDNGDILCVFAEGEITRTGALLPFRRGVERIAKGHDAPIIPVNLDRVWGSIFSRERGRFATKIPRRIPYPVTVSYGEPLPSTTPIDVIRQHVQELGVTAWQERATTREPLHVAFIRAVRRHPLRLAFLDPMRGSLSALRALASAIALARSLKSRWLDQEHVGILLPPSVASALANLAASLLGKRTVNLNYTIGKEGMSSAARQAGLRTVVTSRTFLERAKVDLPEGIEPVWIEEVAGKIGPFPRLISLFLATVVPARWIEAMLADRRVEVDEVATVIFTSGSTGEPKGVQLTHFNIDSNVEAVAQILRINDEDRLLGILPHFHSFGYMTLWFSAMQNLPSVFLPNPLDAAEVGVSIQQHRATLLIATPTFLQIYLRRCTPAQFGSLRLVLTGAEKLPERLAQTFEDHFGIRPLEGYGATECSPVVATSTLDFRAPGFYQPGSRRGSVGQPLPGVAVRVVDPDDLDRQLPTKTPGMLLVRGANVMRGYLGREDLTDKVMREGWYITGDIAAVDEDGFVNITDRLARFSKIGGEMVPHGKIEDALHEAAEVDEQVFAVTGIPDERRGERIAVLHTLEEERVPDIIASLSDTGLPNLFIPRIDQFVWVEAIPILGTGKLDLTEVKRRAATALSVDSGK
ncbi:MAG: acyl-[ACP]--phospholipid O-acyltransferase [Gemmatimonadetes bacterium]|nr:acyl-[ACP]--phospholipid O-acyltransferase [Gemmatimonadota bacterium]